MQSKWAPASCARPVTHSRHRRPPSSVTACIPSDSTVRDVSVGCVSGRGTDENPHDFTFDDRSLRVDPQSGRCELCGGDVLSCPGHQGHLEFPEPFLLPQFRKHIYQALVLVCKFCGAHLWETGALVSTRVSAPTLAIKLTEAELTAARQSILAALPFPDHSAREALAVIFAKLDQAEFWAALAALGSSVLTGVEPAAVNLVLQPRTSAELSAAEVVSAWEAQPNLTAWRAATAAAFGSWRTAAVRGKRRGHGQERAPQACLLVRVRQVLEFGTLSAVGPEATPLLTLTGLVQQERVLHETLVQRLERLAYLGMTRRAKGQFVRSTPPCERQALAGAPQLEHCRQQCRERLDTLAAAVARLHETPAQPATAIEGLARLRLQKDPRAGRLEPEQWRAFVVKAVYSATAQRKHFYLQCSPYLKGCGGAQPTVKERGTSFGCDFREGSATFEPHNMYWRVLLAAGRLPLARLGLPSGLQYAFRLSVLTTSRALLPFVRATVGGRQAMLNYGRDLTQQITQLIELLRCAWEVRQAWEETVATVAIAGGVLLSAELAGDPLAKEYKQTLNSAYYCWHSTFSRGGGDGALEDQLGQVSRNLSELLSKKDGEFRKNGLGKRIDHSARGVLICNALVPLGHVALGLSMLRTLREKILVGTHNLAAVRAAADQVQRARAELTVLRRRLEEARTARRECEVLQLLESSDDLQYNDVYPNFGRLWRANGGPPLALEQMAGDYSSHIEVGDAIEVSLTEGSKVVVNRQPTLSPQSARVFTVLAPRAPLYTTAAPQHYCVALNPIEEIPFNGDNDGDVVTVIALQSLQCCWSSEETMGSALLATSRAAGENVAKLAQDNLAVLFHALTTNQKYRQEELLHLYALLEQNVPAPRGAHVHLPPQLPQPVDGEEETLASCWDVVATFLPQGFVPPWVHGDGSDVEWRCAQRWDKAWLGQGATSLTKLLHADYGPEWAALFLNCVSVFVLWSNERHSTTVNLAELVHDNPWATTIVGTPTIAAAIDHPQPPGRFSWLFREHRLRSRTAAQSAVEDSFRQQCAVRTAQLQTEAAKHQRERYNAEVRGLRVSVASGAKGSIDDLRQLELQTGLHLYEQALISPSLCGRRSAYSSYGDPLDNGFVTNSFMSGLTIREYGWHMVSAREVVGRNVRTVATTGYFQHSLSFALQDVVYVVPGLLIRGGRDVVHVPGRVVDGAAQRPVRSALVDVWFRDQLVCALHPTLHACLAQCCQACTNCATLTANVYRALLGDDDEDVEERERLVRSGLLFEELAWATSAGRGWQPRTVFALPVLAERVRRAHQDTDEKAKARSAAPHKVRALVTRLLHYLCQVPGNGAWCVHQAYVASELTAWRVEHVYHLSLPLLEILLKQVLYCFQVHRLPFGYSMGGVAASSYGHLGTQLTLNTRHKPSNTIRCTEGHPRILALTRLQSKGQDFLLRGRLRSAEEVARWRAVDPARREGVRVLNRHSSVNDLRALLQRASAASLCVALYSFDDYHQALLELGLPDLRLHVQDADLDLRGLRRRRAPPAPAGTTAAGAHKGRKRLAVATAAPSKRTRVAKTTWSKVSRQGALVVFDDAVARAHGFTRGGLQLTELLRSQLPSFAVCSAWASADRGWTCLLLRVCSGKKVRPKARAPAPAQARFDTYQYNHTQLYCESLLRQALAVMQPAIGVDAIDLSTADSVLTVQMRPGRTTLAQVRRLLARPEWVPETVEITDPLVAFQVLGIEACCTALSSELRKALSGLGELDFCHTQLLASTMCLKGLPLPISRAGYAQLEDDPFERALFEKNGRIFLFETVDKISQPGSMYWRFLSGQLPEVGDAYFQISHDSTPGAAAKSD